MIRGHCILQCPLFFEGRRSMKPIPFSTTPETKVPEIPNMSAGPAPEQTALDKPKPVEPEMNRQSPVEPKLEKEMPQESELNRAMPETVPKENCVYIDGKEIEIKPTKLKYFRNKMASAYSVLKIVPLNELLTYGKGVIDDTRDADQLLFDFLIAVFDDPAFVEDHYEDMTADDIEKIFKIFGRLNHIDEKEEQQRKNREAQAQAKR